MKPKKRSWSEQFAMAKSVADFYAVVNPWIKRRREARILLASYAVLAVASWAINHSNYWLFGWLAVCALIVWSGPSMRGYRKAYEGFEALRSSSSRWFELTHPGQEFWKGGPRG